MGEPLEMSGMRHNSGPRGLNMDRPRKGNERVNVRRGGAKEEERASAGPRWTNSGQARHRNSGTQIVLRPLPLGIIAFLSFWVFYSDRLEQ